MVCGSEDSETGESGLITARTSLSEIIWVAVNATYEETHELKVHYASMSPKQSPSSLGLLPKHKKKLWGGKVEYLRVASRAEPQTTSNDLI